MKIIRYFLVFICCSANADQLTEQLNAFDAVQEKNKAAAIELERVQADYARQQATLKQASQQKEVQVMKSAYEKKGQNKPKNVIKKDVHLVK